MHTRPPSSRGFPPGSLLEMGAFATMQSRKEGISTCPQTTYSSHSKRVISPWRAAALPFKVKPNQCTGAGGSRGGGLIVGGEHRPQANGARRGPGPRYIDFLRHPFCSSGAKGGVPKGESSCLPSAGANSRGSAPGQRQRQRTRPRGGTPPCGASNKVGQSFLAIYPRTPIVRPDIDETIIILLKVRPASKTAIRRKAQPRKCQGHPTIHALTQSRGNCLRLVPQNLRSKSRSIRNMKLHSSSSLGARPQPAFAGTRLVARPAARPHGVQRAPAVSTTCGATPKGLPVSVSTYDDDIKEKSRKFRRTVRVCCLPRQLLEGCGSAGLVLPEAPPPRTATCARALALGLQQLQRSASGLCSLARLPSRHTTPHRNPPGLHL